MLSTPDPKLFRLSDAHIDLSNEQMKAHNPKLVSGAMTMSSGKFAAWFCALAATSREEMLSKRGASVEFFTEEFRKAFADEYDRYVAEFDTFKASIESQKRGAS